MVWALISITLIFLAAEIWHDWRAKHKFHRGVDHKAKAAMRLGFLLSIPMLFGFNGYLQHVLIGFAIYWPVFNIAYAVIVAKQKWYYIDKADMGEDNSLIDDTFSEKTIWIGYAIIGALAYLNYLAF